MRPRRLAYILNIFPKLSETFIATELAELRRRGVELRILSLHPPREQVQHAIVRSAGLDRLASYEVAAFPDIVRDFQPDLLHAHFATEATAKARELGAQTTLPFTFTAHGYDIHRQPPADFQQRAEAAQAVVTVSEANAAYIAQRFQVAPARIEVIPCGVDTQRFRPPAAVDVSAPSLPLILCVARHVAVKNLGLLLAACGRLRDSGVRFRCRMVGDGPLRAELEAERARLGLEDVVQMPGAADQEIVAQWWQRAAVGVLTSQNEGMPVSLMEAAASGVPVVATAVGGVPELVRDGVTGLLVPPADPDGLAAALRRLLTDTELRRRMGRAARERAEARFTVARQADALLALWSRVLKGPVR